MGRLRPENSGHVLLSKRFFVLILTVVTLSAVVGSIHFKHIHHRKCDRIARLSHSRCIVVVTEDLCGGSKYSVRLAEILKRKGVQMTFAVPAWEAYAYPDRMKRLHELGGDIINHANDGGASYSFLGRPGKIARLPKWEQRKIIHTAQEWIDKATGVRPDAFRAPGLAVDENTYRALVEEGIWVDSSKIYTKPGTRGAPKWIEGGKILEIPIACYTEWEYRNRQPVRPKFLCSFADDLFVRPKIAAGRPEEALENLKRGFDQYYRHGRPGRPTVFVVLFHEHITANPKYWWIILEFVDYARSHPGVAFATIDDVAELARHGQRFTSF
ncbi:polysaccharide deacetylase family protein [Methanopyrus sp.]